MNLPNKLTIARTLLAPLFLLFLLVPSIPGNYLWACIVFAVASITDWLDGHIARSNDSVTTFGKFLDPLADKILVTGALVAFVALDLAGPIPVIIIIARDFMVSAIRLVAATAEGKVIAANWWGKIKTATQMVVIITVLLACHVFRNNADVFMTVAWWSRFAMWLLAAFTLLSGIVYVIQNKHLIDTYK